MSDQPCNVASRCVLLDLTKELDRLGLVARFAGVSIWNDHFNIHSDDVTVGMNESCSSDSFSVDAHGGLLVHEVYGDQFRNVNGFHM